VLQIVVAWPFVNRFHAARSLRHSRRAVQSS
jgi:hypothetical protein